MDASMIERGVAIVGGFIVGVVASIALKNDWKTPGLDNQVFKVMLGLLALGGLIGLLAGIGVLGTFPKAA